jgi:hypothetical protein
MALLTEEQINDILDITNVCESSIVVSKLIEWNEKQTSQQIWIDWNDAPKYISKVQLRLHWVTESSGSELWSTVFESVTFERPKPIITSHPHAKIMAKYAEVAARRVDPWVEFELKISNDKWVKIHQFSFDAHLEYRHIGETK